MHTRAGVPSERRQFRILYRDFLSRLVDLEAFSSRGEIQKLLVQFVSMMAAFSFVFAMETVTKYVASPLPRATLMKAARVDEEFLLASTMAIAGLFSILAWNAMFPDRRDCLVLGLLPVRARTIFLAKAAAIASSLGVCVVATNCFTGLMFPFLFGGLGSFAAYWLKMISAGLFVGCALVALQGLAAQVLSCRLFLRASSFLQIGSFFVILGAYFLKPPLAREKQFPWFPSFWFIDFGRTAIYALATVVFLAVMTFALAYRRNLRRIVEQPDIAPADRSRPASRAAAYLATRLLARPIDRAIVLFTGRTIARSKQHRLILAAYLGIGLAIALAYSRELIYGGGDPLERTFWKAPWNQPNMPFLVASLVLLFFAAIGTRAVFALPIALRAKWIFEITAVQSPAAYFGAVRKALYAIAAIPVWTISAVVYFAIWPVAGAAEHLAVLGAVAILVVETSLRRFRKIPFACAYLPGKSNIHVRLGCYGIGFLFVASQGVHLEYWSMQGVGSFLVLLAVLGALAAWARRRTTAALPYNRLQFEDLPEPEIEALDLHGGSSRIPAYVDFTEPRECAPLWTILEQAVRDLRYGARILTRSPGLSAAAIALIVIGVGGNTTIYSIIHSVLTKPAPGVHAGRLVSLGVVTDGRGPDPNGGSDSYLNYLDYAELTQTMRYLAAAVPDRYTAGIRGATWEMRGQLVSPNYFRTLGVSIVKGREFTAEEASGMAPPAAIIAWHVWQNQFEGADDVIGQSVTLNGRPVTVVGVTERKFHGVRFAPDFEIGVPLTLYSERRGMAFQDRAERGVQIVGQLAPGVSLSEAQAEFDTFARRIAEAYPAIARGRRIVLEPYSATAFGIFQGGQARFFMAILTVVALLTLLIVCANVANLMLARAAMRQREMAVRQSIGASRARILRIQLAEGFVLSLAAWAAACLFAEWACGAIVKFVPPLESGARLAPDLAPDWRVTLYALLLAVFATVAFTVAPAVRGWRQELLPYLKAGEHCVIEGRSRLANVLVVAQLALCVLLLTSAGLAWRSARLMDATGLSFDKNHLVLAGVDTSGAAVTGAQNLAVLEHLRQRLLAVPGLVTVSYAQNAPPRAWNGLPVTAAGATKLFATDGNFVGPDYLRALGVPILAGRGLSEGETSGAVINQKLAQALWHGETAVGRMLTIAGAEFVVAGVVPNGAFSAIGPGGGVSLRQEDRGNFVFLPLRDGPAAPGRYVLHLRYAGSLGTISPSIRAALREAEPRAAVFGLRTMEDEWDEFLGPVHFITDLLGLFGSASLLLAAIGLYAVAAFYTARRTREFGIRMALGSSPRRTVEEVLKEGLLLAGVGVGIGLALSAAAGRVFRSFLFGVTPTDTATYMAVTGLLAAVSLLACYIPARRAARVDPMRALRAE